MIEYRKATLADLDTMVEIEKECFTVPWSRQSIEFELVSPDSAAIVAVDGEKLAGFAVLHRFVDEGELFNIAVKEDFRRRGIADALMAEVLSCARAWELRRVMLEVRKSNAAARALYSKHGFEVMGMRPGYYDLPKEDAILMEKYSEG